MAAINRLVRPRINGPFEIGLGLPPVHMTLQGYDLGIGGSDEYGEFNIRCTRRAEKN